MKRVAIVLLPFCWLARPGSLGPRRRTPRRRRRDCQGRCADHFARRPEADRRNVVLRAGHAPIRRPEGGRPPGGGTPRPAAPTAPGGHGMVRAVECTSPGQFRPFHGDYSPGWASNNVYYPYRWTSGAATVIVVRPNPDQHAR